MLYFAYLVLCGISLFGDNLELCVFRATASVVALFYFGDGLMFKELLKRADFSNISEFIMSGGELVDLPTEETIEERIKEAYNKIYNFIETNFKQEQHDEKAEELTYTIGVLESSFFELGLLSGIKIGTQFQKKMQEIL